MDTDPSVQDPTNSIQSDADPDGTQSDIGAYGGPGADKWDLDGDSYPGWFWPGTIDVPPNGFSRSSYDADDQDLSVH